ncbi:MULTISPECIES: TetR/AcrR family transcriptional regulator [Streptomyces]|uniref:TetR family transcriptional regulator n=2 Tax=Streptomyces TaxID=1883 RepID=A0A0W7X8C0_9ACTN|nr:MULTISPECIES: TetR/AcrR family transcriptional regulator [Streptomyces]KUF18996.1 TetR family transcriptional regulator [Streptomyces silvensis]MVO89456.1 TetR family transcriptional regulator [Streptomyces typhae]
MSPDNAQTARPTLRERRRAVAVQEIVSAAEAHIAEDGPHGLSLRAVARSLGMTVQALYHYFPSRDDLVTALITKAYDDLADAVQQATEIAPEDPDLPGLVVAAEGYRRWAIDHPERFQLLYGTPLRHYHAPVDGPTTEANRRMSAVFERELFGGFTRAQLAAADVRSLSPEFLVHLEHMAPSDGLALPPAATALLLSVWGYVHGMVVLEVFGHTGFLGVHQAELYRMAMRNLYEDVHRRVPGPGAA